VERLLKIPIRRISLYDINRAKKEMEEINTRLKEIKYHLSTSGNMHCRLFQRSRKNTARYTTGTHADHLF
jgi:hypothetical protein